MSMGGGPWSVMHSFRQDSTVKQQKLKPGTVPRILDFARPYRRFIAFFLVLVVIDAVLVVATPLIFGRIIDDGVSTGNTTLVVQLSLLVAGIAVVSAVIGLVQRYFSSRIGEGLIYDLRTSVFSHVQRMPVAFFTRTQTGALISRLNNDVIGAQQAFTSTLSGVVSNTITLVLVTIAMMALSWQITLAALLMLPLFLWPAKRVGRQLQSLTRQSMQVNAEMSTMMTERFNVSGALLVKLFGRPEEEDSSFSSKAGRVRDMGVRIAMSNRVFFTALTLVASLATALVYGVGGVPDHPGRPDRRDPGCPGRSPGAPLRPADRAVQRAGRRHDRAGVLRAGLRGPRPAADDRREGRRHRHRTRTHLDRLRPCGASGTPPLTRCRWPRWRASPCSTRRPPSMSCTTSSFTVEPGQLVALVGPSGAGKTTITSLVARLYDVTGGAVRVGGHDVRDLTLEALHDVVGVVTQDAHMFHETIRSNLLYADPEATDDQLAAACRDAQIWELVSARCRTGSTRWSETGGTGSPAVRSSDWPSPDCC